VTPTEAAVERIRRAGPLRFDEVVELALYADEGFFTVGAGAGRRADFITSPEVGPLFGAVIARALDTWWDEAGQPDPWLVVEAGAGRGALAAAVLAAAPRCSPALRYVCVERSPVLRHRQSELLALEPPVTVFGAVLPDEAGDEASAQPGTGPLVTSLAELPALTACGVVLANELLDNLPFRLLERTPTGWAEVMAAADGGALRELLVELDADARADADGLAPDATPGSRIPLQAAAGAWLRRALGFVERGRVVAIDYAATTPELAARPWEEWLRTYRSHGRGGHPLDDLGAQDVTCEVAVDQLARVAPPAEDRAQAEFLATHGIDELVAAARSAWHERAHVGDLEAMKARSRVGEGDALVDPAGLGAFRVLEWAVGPAVTRR
jgi:SAM-dependent MidA family methyltransferase